MKILISFLILSLPQTLLAECLERYYKEDHLVKNPNQEIRTVLMSWDGKWDPVTEKVTNVFNLQITLLRDDKTIVAQAEGICDSGAYDLETKKVTCTLNGSSSKIMMEKATGEFKALATIDKNTQFRNVTYGAKSGEQVSLRNFDSEFRLTLDPQTEYGGDCESILYKPNTLTTPRLWNEAIQFSIRNDLARPTVTARNLYHLSALLWDTFASFDKNLEGYYFKNKFKAPSAAVLERRRNTAISYAAYVFLLERYKMAPGNTEDNIPFGDGDSGDGVPDKLIDNALTKIMFHLGLDPDLNATKSKTAAAQWGVEIAQTLLQQL